MNIHSLLLLFAFLFAMSSLGPLFATDVFNDTTQPRKPYKISKKLFLSKYGNGSKTGMFINYFFKRRVRSGRDTMIIGGIVLIICGILFALFALSNAGMGIIISLFFGLAAYGGFVVAVIGTIFFLSFPRKRLWEKLNRMPTLKNERS